MKLPAKGKWITFRNGELHNGKGGNETLQLDSHPQDVRYLRIWMTGSSNTCDNHGPADPRNCVGYAIRELYVGLADSNGFHDTVRHTADQDQTATFCSSVDPWHRAGDIGSSLHEQVGLDAFYQSGYTRGLPAMVPVSILYGIPEDSANEVAYLEKHGYLISYVEIGEEPDGQYMLPEDYGALYLQWATALHKVDPALKLGGPVFTGQNEDILVWRDAKGKMSWTGRFLDYLKSHGRMQDLAFFSFEHYPYEPCKISWNNLYDEPELMRHILQVWRKDGLPENVPMFVTESNITWNAGESSLDIFGALWLADYVGSFFTAGGNALYYFHYLPLGVERGCNDSGGTFGMFTVDRNYDIQQPTSQFFASQLITTEWVQPGSAANQIYAAEANIEDSVGHSLVTAYALLRPDGLWSLLVVNRDQENAHTARISFERGRGAPQFFVGAADVLTFDRARYVWHPEPLPYQPFAEKTVGGFASPSQSFGHAKINASPTTIYDLPAASVTVIRGKIGFEK
jgi:hypothetical protein